MGYSAKVSMQTPAPLLLVTFRRAMMLMPLVAKPGAFFDFLPVPFSSLCRRASKVTSSVAAWTVREFLVKYYREYGEG